MKLLLILVGITVLGASCSTMKKASAPPAEQQRRMSGSSTSSTTANPVFIDNISFKPGTDQQSSTTRTFEKGPSSGSAIISNVNTDYNATAASGMEALTELRFKYAILLDEPVEAITDLRLLEFIDEWYGTRYRLGGTDKNGIDCSAFSQSFLTAMYGIGISRTCREQYAESKRIKKAHLEEGDLVFFKTRGKSISHVGVYLRNNKFIHASTSSGIMISDLSEDYFSRRYAGAGRF
ncbi:MAG TPA: NlpC/P60 family protein [Chitinophagaceae bacterium]